jgi:acetylornithine deacetylase/succinyl-diaminopimelate desuccinylase-like protein
MRGRPSQFHPAFESKENDMTYEDQMTKVDQYIEQHVSEFLQDLAALCALPSVAAQHQSIEETAEFTRGLLEKYGFDARVMPSTGNPMVYGELAGAGDQTLLCYNHYDVQPAEPLELWHSPPFEATERDGKLYARGVVDDKGHIVCRLAAVAALKEVLGEVPCSVKMLIEGEEEIGSMSMEPFIEQHRDLLSGADGCLWEFGGVDYDDRPGLVLGMRGDLYVELRARTISHDAHSGVGGSIFPNAAWRLTWALATLKGQDEHIRISGWYDDVRAPTDREIELLQTLPPSDEALKEAFGIDAFLKNVEGVEMLRQQLLEPTCTIAGLGSGYQGPGSKTVLPAEAMAKIDFRLVPDQDPNDLVEKLRRHLDAEGFDDIELIMHGGSRAARVDPDAPFVQLVIDTARDVYGAEPVVAPTSGGSGPMDPFVRLLNVPISNAGVGYPHTLVHSPNENMRISDFVKGIKHTARVMAGMSG